MDAIQEQLSREAEAERSLAYANLQRACHGLPPLTPADLAPPAPVPQPVAEPELIAPSNPGQAAYAAWLAAQQARVDGLASLGCGIPGLNAPRVVPRFGSK
jgi:hypothetical protein